MDKRKIIINKVGYPFEGFSPENLVRAVNAILWLMLLITALSVFVPFSPGMPEADLDSSWKFGLNQAMAQGFTFGKGIIFTYGPYASIHTRQYHPATDFMMVMGGLYLALSYWACFWVLMKEVKWRWALVFFASLAGLPDVKNALFFSLPLLVGLVIFKILIWQEGRLARHKWTPFYIALLCSTFGLLPLIKGSLLILCGAIYALCAVFFMANSYRYLAIICLFAPMAAMLFFWIAAGQSVANLPNYVIGMAAISSGYTEAMAIDGNFSEAILYLLASAFLLLVIALQKQRADRSKIFVFGVYFCFLFLSFKAGFVRHDYHALITSQSILIAALLLPFIFNKWVIPAITAAFIVTFYINSHYINESSDIINRFESTYSSAWVGINNRLENRGWLRHSFDAAVKSLREQASFPVLEGTTDIYSCNQSYLIASGNTWSPRPIFQSYSVYTPDLVALNKKYLLSRQAPDNIVFKVEPIDGRLAAIEDGASWPILMQNYRPTLMSHDFLWLKKMSNTNELEEPLLLTSEKQAFGARVNLPQSNGAIFARIEIKPTILGRLATILFKPSQLSISLELNNGNKRQYRIIAGMAKSGFVISPLIENTSEFGLLYGNNGFLDEKRVKSITIAPGIEKSMFWDKDYLITFSQIKITSPFDVSTLYQFDKFDDELSIAKVTAAEKCDGFIDDINGMSPMPAKLFLKSRLKISGWLVASTDKAVLPEAVYVLLTDRQGNHKYLKTHLILRPDVGEYYNRPALNASGFETIADISALEGQYTLGLAMKQSGKIQRCRQFKIPATIAMSQYPASKKTK